MADTESRKALSDVRNGLDGEQAALRHSELNSRSQAVAKRTVAHPVAAQDSNSIGRHYGVDRRIEQLRRLIETALEHVLVRSSGAPEIVHEAMRYGVFSGGKRFRPLLCLGASEAVGAPARRALPIACAIELIHTYSLVHDDLPAMDNADERRGRPSCHRKFGEGNAILVGDALLTLAFELLGRVRVPAGPGILQTLGRACGTAGLIGGQVLDLEAARRPQRAAEELLRDIARRKTAALISASAVAGGLAGGASAPSLSKLRRYGEGVGLAFQLMDDVHDREGLAEVMGLERTRAEAQRLIAEAIQALRPFGDRAELLRRLATWLSTS